VIGRREEGGFARERDSGVVHAGSHYEHAVVFLCKVESTMCRVGGVGDAKECRGDQKPSGNSKRGEKEGEWRRRKTRFYTSSGPHFT
jgi:hypothetical protein